MDDARRPARPPWPALRLRAGAAPSPMGEELAEEEPLELRIDGEVMTTTLRSPGDDLDLVAGFLASEGVIDGPDDILAMAHVDDPASVRGNTVDLRLAPGVPGARRSRLGRSLFISGACGLCGSAGISALRGRLAPLPPLDPAWAELLQPERLCQLPAALEAQQGGFVRTGGQHAAALVDREGRLELVREDVGRHNAVDKVIGARLRADRYPLSDALLLVSSRAGYEIAQKAVVARVPILATIGAPSRLACELAAELGLWLYGFVRRDRCTRYWPPPEGR